MRKILISIIIIICVFLTGCNFSLTEEQKEEARIIIDTYSEAFEQQVKKQYGDKARISNIEVVTNQYADSLGDILILNFKYNLTNNLIGDLTINREQTRAMYLSQENVVIRDRAKELKEKHTEEAKNFFKNIFNIDFNYVSLPRYDSAMFLPDEINTFEEVVSQTSIEVTLYSTQDIRNITEDSFVTLRDNTKIEIKQIVQVEEGFNLKKAEDKLSKAKISSISFYFNFLHGTNVSNFEEFRRNYYDYDKHKDHYDNQFSTIKDVGIIRGLGYNSSKDNGMRIFEVQ